MIKIVAGLGNPGREYEATRHNIGFALVERLAAKYGGMRWVSTGGGSEEGLTTSATQLGQGEVRLIKPMTYMNRSGVPLAAFARFYKVAPHEIAVLQDEIDLKLGDVRVKIGGGDGGHNGIKSIASMLGTKDFHRVRLGVGRPELTAPESGVEGLGKKPEVSNWVLGRFTSLERDEVEKLLVKGEEALLRLIKAEAERV